MDQVKKLFLDKDFVNKVKHLNVLEQTGNTICKEDVLKVIDPVTSTQSTCSTLVGQDVMSDVEMYQAFDGSTATGTVQGAISEMFLKGTELYFTQILSHPISCIETLKKRQQVVKDISKLQVLDPLFLTMAECEPDMLWLYQNQETEIVSLYDMVYFKFVLLKNLNDRPECLTLYNLYKIILSPIIGLLSPVVYLLIPYMIMRIKMKINIGFLSYIKMMIQTMLQGTTGGGIMSSKMSYISFAFSLLFYFQGLFNNVELAKAIHNISGYITNKMNNVIKFVTAAEKLFELTAAIDIDSFNIPVTYECTSEFTELSTTPFTSLSHFGTHLHAFKFFDKEHYKHLLKKAYLLDAVVNISRIQTRHQFCFPEYVDEKKPFLKLTDLWHPSLTNPVKNNVELDRSIIITGPNAGGKSTMIKGTLIALLFSQTLGIANTGTFKMTPLHHINSQMNIPDCKGKASLFEAEMYRSKHNIDVLKENKMNDSFKSIIFMDEIFNSTNPVEGIAGAYAIAKNMSSYPNNISVITTHYLYLTKLQKDFPERFKNLKMNVRNPTGDIVYPYKLTPGISRQFIAIEILKMNGFDKEIVDDALVIKNKLMATATATATVKSENITVL